MLTLETAPMPPEARLETLDGAYETPLDLAVAAVRDVLRDPYGAVDVEIYTLPPEIEWQYLVDFYNGALAEGGWTAVDNLMRSTRQYDLATWSRSRFPGQEVFAIALVRYEPTNLAFLAVMVTRQ